MSLRDSSLSMRLLCGAAAVVMASAAGAAHAQSKIDIPPQPLASALTAFSVQSDRTIIATGDLTGGKTTRGVSGISDPDAALRQMLAGTGLDYTRSDTAYMIVRADAPVRGGSSFAQADQGGSVAAVEELIVTAQKKGENIQDVPIAISAFTMQQLDAQKIEGGFDLLKGVPNVTFSKTNFAGYNFSIRGIGTQAVSASTDPAVAVSFNNTTLIVNRLFEQEYVDIERVEVLRGPQGTLYGRNATSGVINVISAKPKLGEFEGELKLEGGNFNARRVRGHVNIPVGETLAVRVAGALTQRDGYGVNLAADDPANNVRRDVDGRDLWTGRVTVGWEPNERLRANLLWERFEEDDSRVRTSKQLCHRDDGPRTVGAWDWENIPDGSPLNELGRAFWMSQGCVGGSLYDEGAYGTPNGLALPFVGGFFLTNTTYGAATNWNVFGDFGIVGPEPRCETEASFGQAGTFRPVGMTPIDPCQPDVYGGQTQSHDLRTIVSKLEPQYRAKADLFHLSVDYDLTDSLTLTSETAYVRDQYYATQDYNRFTTLPVFQDSSLALDPDLFPAYAEYQLTGGASGSDAFLTSGGTAYGGYFADVAPGGIFCDYQLGCSNTIVAQDLVDADSRQFNQEFRLASNFDGPVNFNLGVNYTQFETETDYYVFVNLLTMLVHTGTIFNGPGSQCFEEGTGCVYIDDSPGGIEGINGEGHNYFRSANPYELKSSAIFGELYWQATPTLKFTGGLRLTWDRKVFTPIPSQLLLFDYREVSIASGPPVPPGSGPEVCYDSGEPLCKLSGDAPGGRGSLAYPDIVQEWYEPTGRLVATWQPELGFTDETMVYGSYSHGYKGGGANPPQIAAPARLFIAAAGGGIGATFEPEYVDAVEVGTKNTLLQGALTLNATAFYYDYKAYQVSKIVDRTAANENFDAEVWGLEFESLFSPTRNLTFNAAIGYLQTRIGDGEQSIDLMDRTQGGNQSFTAADGTVYDEWVLIKPFVAFTSNCIAPLAVAEQVLLDSIGGSSDPLEQLCAGGSVLVGGDAGGRYGSYNVRTDAPNAGAGFFADLGGNELPNAPHWTASLGAQYRMALPGGWDATLRGDFYWQSQSFARVYNSQYDKLRAWTNTNISLWFDNPEWDVKAEVYVKNVFDETPITGAFLNSDDSGLTTNVFTLDPRLVGVSVTKRF